MANLKPEADWEQQVERWKTIAHHPLGSQQTFLHLSRQYFVVLRSYTARPCLKLLHAMNKTLQNQKVAAINQTSSNHSLEITLAVWPWEHFLKPLDLSFSISTLYVVPFPPLPKHIHKGLPCAHGTLLIEARVAKVLHYQPASTRPWNAQQIASFAILLALPTLQGKKKIFPQGFEASKERKSLRKIWVDEQLRKGRRKETLLYMFVRKIEKVESDMFLKYRFYETSLLLLLTPWLTEKGRVIPSLVFLSANAGKCSRMQLWHRHPQVQILPPSNWYGAQPAIFFFFLAQCIPKEKKRQQHQIYRTRNYENKHMTATRVLKHSGFFLFLFCIFIRGIEIQKSKVLLYL